MFTTNKYKGIRWKNRQIFIFHIVSNSTLSKSHEIYITRRSTLKSIRASVGIYDGYSSSARARDSPGCSRIKEQYLGLLDKRPIKVQTHIMGTNLYRKHSGILKLGKMSRAGGGDGAVVSTRTPPPSSSAIFPTGCMYTSFARILTRGRRERRRLETNRANVPYPAQ